MAKLTTSPSTMGGTRSFSTCQPALEITTYFSKWSAMSDYVSQENALNSIFLGASVLGFSESELMVKCATLNDFYSTYIFKVYYVVQHYLSVPNLAKRLATGDVTLVDNLRKVPTPRTVSPIDFYSFATKFCSHHNPAAFPICDKFAINALYEFKKRDNFYNFTKCSLSNYLNYIKAIDEFRAYYGLNSYSYKDIDKYLWLIGREIDGKIITFP